MLTRCGDLGGRTKASVELSGQGDTDLGSSLLTLKSLGSGFFMLPQIFLWPLGTGLVQGVPGGDVLPSVGQVVEADGGCERLCHPQWC